MKAIRIYGPKDARYEEVPRPEPRPDEALVRVRASGLCATDHEYFTGEMPYVSQGLTRLPLIPGHEWSGEVVEVGSEAKDQFTVGDRVAGECSLGCLKCEFCIRGEYNQCPHRRETGLLNKNGAFAEYIRFPRYFLHKCTGVDFEASAFTEPTGVAVYAMKTARVSPGDAVLVVGAGPIGLFCVQVARAYGARTVMASDVRDDRIELAKALGADAGVNVATGDVREAALEATGGRLFDVAVEACGSPDALERTIEPAVRPRARIVMVGLTSGRRASLSVDDLVIQNWTIHGTLGGPGIWPEAISLIERGLVKVHPLITHKLGLSEYHRAIQIMKESDENAIKIILDPKK
jgi:threonine dehydrogenase-like Zn-dependent dehydrogenase